MKQIEKEILKENETGKMCSLSVGEAGKMCFSADAATCGDGLLSASGMRKYIWIEETFFI